MCDATKMISGKALKESFNDVKQMAPGMIPGGALIGGAAKKTGEAIGEGAKKFAEGAKKAGGAIAGAVAGAAGGEGDMGDIAEGAMQGAQQAGGKDGKGGKGGAENSREIDAENAIGEDGNPLDDIAGDDKENPLDANPLDVANAVTTATGDPILGAVAGELVDGEPAVDKDGNPIENAGPGGPGQGNMDENWIRSIVRDEMNGGKGGAENARSGAADPTMEVGKDGKDGKLPFLATNIDPEKAKASKEEIEARGKLKEDKVELKEASKDYKLATNNREKLEKEYVKNGGKLDSLDKDDSEAGKALKKAMQSESNAKGRFDKAQKAVTDDKAAVESSMTPERKAARRMQIANTIMSGVGSAATVAATIAGGPIAGILVHKTAKNLKKAAPGVVNASIAKFGELKTKAKEGVKAFKDADGLGKAEMISNFAMKGAGVAAKGALAATAIGFAAPVVLPALGAVNSVTSAVGVPLWAVGATALSGKLSGKFSGEGGAQGGGLLSRIVAGKDRVVQPGAGGTVPEGSATQAPQTGAKPAGAENARQAGAQGASKPKRNLEMTQEEKDARENLGKASDNLQEKKAAQRKIAKNAKEREKIANDNSLSQHDKDLRLQALDKDDEKQKAKLGIVDRIFCRVGASDNLAKGESTFLVEMSETALILRSATEKSLVIMDEVGRGTSTEDGLSLAWAISEYLLHTIKSKTLFATHYHQLTRMEHQNLQMLCMDVLETDGKIIFLRKVIEGATQNSYGLHVAQLAGIPREVVNRAQSILEVIVKNSNIYTDSTTDLGIYTQQNQSSSTEKKLVPSNTLPGLFSDEEMVLDSILSTDVNSITPLEALAKISEWKKLLSTN